MTPEKKRVIERVRALDERTVANGCTPAEADTAKRLADKLLAKHGLKRVMRPRPKPQPEHHGFGFGRTFDHGPMTMDDLFAAVMRMHATDPGMAWGDEAEKKAARQAQVKTLYTTCVWCGHENGLNAMYHSAPPKMAIDQRCQSCGKTFTAPFREEPHATPQAEAPSGFNPFQQVQCYMICPHCHHRNDYPYDIGSQRASDVCKKCRTPFTTDVHRGYSETATPPGPIEVPCPMCKTTNHLNITGNFTMIQTRCASCLGWFTVNVEGLRNV